MKTKQPRENQRNQTTMKTWQRVGWLMALIVLGSAMPGRADKVVRTLSYNFDLNDSKLSDTAVFTSADFQAAQLVLQGWGWAKASRVDVKIYAGLSGELQVDNQTPWNAEVGFLSESTLDVSVHNGAGSWAPVPNPLEVDASGTVLAGPGNSTPSYSSASASLSGWSAPAASFDPFSSFTVALTADLSGVVLGNALNGKNASVYGGTKRQTGYVQLEYTFSVPEALNTGTAFSGVLGFLLLWRRRCQTNRAIPTEGNGVEEDCRV